MRTFIRSSIFGVAVWAASSLAPRAASACGGFFCNQAQPVNQAAEGIVFADNGDGTVTAVIQIQYQGPSKSFSWLLPISSVPKEGEDIGVASNLAFQRLQAATNPSYTLTTRIEGTCRSEPSAGGYPSGSVGAAGASSGPPLVIGGDGVTVEASGVVGAFEWKVISLDASLADPATAAVNWLTENGYDVPSSAPQMLGPYLRDGLYLLALRLTKGADTGSIRPIVLTYKGTQPSIPIKLTAVAANEDMGVLTWVLGKSRAVPQNYLSLELNEARINWFNANSNYNSVVTEAADDAGGQGFVTEFSGASSTLAGRVWTSQDDSQWKSLKTTVYQAFGDLFMSAYFTYGAWDGFWDAVQATVTLPTGGPSIDDLKLCPNCYRDKLQGSPAAFVAELDKGVIEPVKSIQNLIDAHPEITRMYTTMSADEMTLDPLFTFNGTLKEVNNVHTAERIIECNPGLYQSQAPWRIELPQGGVVRGIAQNVGTWPSQLGALPPNQSITQLGASGTGKVLEDQSKAIQEQLAAYNAMVPTPLGVPSGGSGSSGSSGNPGGSAGSGAQNNATLDPPVRQTAGGGCSVASRSTPFAAYLSVFAFGFAVLRRRRRC